MSENFEFSVETKKILKLMIHSLYTNKDIAIRELISNASDACDKLRYQANINPDLLGEDSELGIHVDIDEENKILSITDNGIGMNKEDLISQLGTIARSGTEMFMKSLENNDKEKNLQLIGQFGVGFYSSFMIAQKVEVISKKLGENEAYIWESEGEGDYNIRKCEDENVKRGTTIKLYLKDDEKDFLDKFHIKHIVQSYSEHITFPIKMKMGTTDASVETLNSGSALWAKSKSEITKEQYNEFYKHIVHMPGEPFMILHNKVEGNIEFTNLLFIPDKRTYDLFNPDRNTKVKLYIKKVFITENSVELLPRYLRFVQGVIDSEDLPLNINRESLQYNNMVAKINKALTKKIFTELAKKDEAEPEEYLKFWENFGSVLKEGLCEFNVNSDELIDLCKFYTSKSPDKPISIKTYVDRMKEGQQDIYYISGDNVDSLENSPQVEGFKSRDIEVVYLTDMVDNFWTTVVTKYKEKSFKSITKADIDLDNLNPIVEEKDDDNAKDLEFDDEKAKKEEELKNVSKDKEDSEGLIIFFKNVLEKCNIKDVKVSKKLTSSPVCLVSDEKAMDIRLEKYLLDQKQITTALPKVLEININHELIKKIKDNLTNTDKIEDIKEMVKTLYDEACVLEGEQIANPSDFARRINKMLNFD